jgi:hypothetical protein
MIVLNGESWSNLGVSLATRQGKRSNNLRDVLRN